MKQEKSTGLKKTEGDKTLYFISPKGVEHFNLSNGDDESNVYCYLHTKGNNNAELLEAHDYNIYATMPWAYDFILECLNYTAPQTISDSIKSLIKEKNIDPTQLSILEMGALTGLLGRELKKDITPTQLIGTDISTTVRTLPLTTYDQAILLPHNGDDDYEEIGKTYTPNFLTACGTFAVSPSDRVTIEFAYALNSIKHEKDGEGYFVIDVVQTDMTDPNEKHPTKLMFELLKSKDYIEYTMKPDIPYRTQTHGNGTRSSTVISGRKLKQIPEAVLQEIKNLSNEEGELV